jgi:hypothetical protein
MAAALPLLLWRFAQRAALDSISPPSRCRRRSHTLSIRTPGFSELR